MTQRLNHIATRKARRAHRVRSQLSGSAERPRLHVKISNRHVSAQIINDEAHQTLAASSTVGKKADASKTMTAKAEWVGADIAKKASAKKISKVVLDRGSRTYHGRIKALADAARAAGLEF